MRYKGKYSWINKKIEKYNQDLAKAGNFREIRTAVSDFESWLGSDWRDYVPEEDRLRDHAEDLRREAEKKLENKTLNRLHKELQRAQSTSDYDALIDTIREVRFDHLPYLRRGGHDERNQGKIDTFFPLFEASHALREGHIRRKAIKDVTKRVSRAKTDKELEVLAQEVGSLQAQPEYFKTYGKVLEDLQAKIEEKYSVVGKGMRFIKKLFSRGRRASQIRTASQMLKQINKEIADLKKEL